MKPLAAEVQMLESRQLLANIHFIGSPEITVTGRTVDACFTVAGIGNQPITATLTAVGTADIRIDNPGGNDPPGQQIPFVLTTDDFTRVDNKNGTTTFCGSLTVTDEDILSGVKLKRGWTATVESVVISDTSLTVTQGQDTITA